MEPFELTEQRSQEWLRYPRNRRRPGARLRLNKRIKRTKHNIGLQTPISTRYASSSFSLFFFQVFFPFFRT